jgi:hypothetical protein
VLQRFDFGERLDLLTKDELTAALREDALIRAAVVGVKVARPWFNLGAIGPAASSFTTPANMVNSGYTWSIMSAGAELSANAFMRVTYGRSSGAIDGSNRVAAGWTTNTGISWQSFSKGQLILQAGEQLVFTPAGAVTILSLALAAIEIPAERIGELLL